MWVERRVLHFMGVCMHYQRQGLIMEPAKPEHGFRQYPVSAIDRLRFIKRAKKLGFSLKEIKQLELGGSHCKDIQILVEEKQRRIHQQIEGLRTIQLALDEMISSCKTGENADQCAFIDTLCQKGFLDD